MNFPQGSQKSEKFWHLTLGNAGKKTFKQGKKIREKNNRKKLFLLRRFHTCYEQKVSNLRPLCSMTFPQGFKNRKSLDIRIWEVGAKRPLTRVRNTFTKKILLIKAKFAQKQTFLCAAILHPLLFKVFKSETTSLHYISLRIPNL